MAVIDRIILSSIALGLWAWVLISIFSSGSLYALSINASEVGGLKRFVEKVVEDCTVDGETISC